MVRQSVHEIAFRLAYLAFVLAVVGYVSVRGGWPERAGIAVCVVGSVLSVVVELPVFAPYRVTMWGVLGVDLAVAAGFLAIGSSSGRFWPTWSLGFTLAGIFAHVARHSMTTVSAERYFHASGLWAYPVMLAIVVGTRLEATQRPMARS